MFAIIVISSIIGLTLLVYLFFKRFTIVRVNGDSMYPTYKHGQLRIMDRLSIKNINIYPEAYKDRIFVINTPDGVPAIKRLKQVPLNPNELFLWFEGDNPPVSRDSRHYGFLRPHNVIGEVVTIKAIITRLWRRNKRGF